jgi:hypothetical protein
MADNDDVIPVCTDESYLHNNHASGMSCYANKELMGKSASEGKGLPFHVPQPPMALCASETQSQKCRATT